MPPTKQRNRLDRILEAPWALHPAALGRVVEWARAGASSELVAAAMTGQHGAPQRSAVAVIPIYGVIEQHSDLMMEMFGDGTSVDGLRETLRVALADPEVAAVVFDIDSPGGTVAGVTELATEIRAARGGAKPIVAVANAFTASAAYWLASQADEMVVSPSAQIGSIGVYAMHQDMSGQLAQDGIAVTLISAGPHKTEGNMFEPLSDEARADIQERVDASYQTFVADVAAGRRVSVEQVESDFGGGRMLTAKKAVIAGMADRVETLGQTITRLGRASGRRQALGAAAETVTLVSPAGMSVTTSDMTGGLDDEGGEIIPFAVQLAEAAEKLSGLVERATTRAALRSTEGRPAYNTNTERSLRTIREAVDALLEPDDPAPSPPAAPDDPVPAAPIQPPIAAIPLRRVSDKEWRAYLQEH
jgi:signal peptide peptidase SppA